MKKILITGASKGIGKYLLERFAASSEWNVFGTYAHTTPDGPYQQYYSKVDVGDDTAVMNWVSQSVNSDDDIVLLNCAGGNYNAIARKADMSQWKELINVNLIGAFRAIHAVLPYMCERKFGRIINFSSIVAQKGIPGTSAYAASKSGLWGLTKCLATENAKFGITVNTFNLGYFNIGMTLSDVPDFLREEIIKQIPGHELGDPDNIYRAINFIINSPFLNGTTIDINGGLF